MNDALMQQWGRFDFLQLVRLHLRPPAPGRPPEKLDDVLRFRADLGAGFPGSNASGLRWLDRGDGDGSAAAGRAPLLEVTTPDFCLGSVLGPLPEPFLEWMRELERSGQPGMRAFLDVFNHRINALRYQGRALFEPGLGNEPPARTLQASWLAALMGVGSEHAAAQIPLRERNWLGIGELMANNRRSAAGVAQVLAAYLHCPVALVPLVGAWRAVEPQDRHALGRRRLGVDSLLGRSTWDLQAAVRLEAGPMDYGRLVALLPPAAALRPQPAAGAESDAEPGTARALQRQWRLRQDGAAGGGQAAPPPGAAFDALAALVRLMLDRQHDAQIDIQVPERSIPPSVLTAHPPAGQAGLRLGQTAWLKARSRRGDGVAVRLGARRRHRVVRLQVPAHPQEPGQ